MNSSNPRFGSVLAPNSLEGATQAVKEKAGGIGEAVSETAKAVKQNVSEMATTAAETVGKAWDGTRHAAEDFGSDAAHRAEVIHADAVIFIRRNPVATVLGALGVGVLLGAVLFAGARARG
jgi:ElaB/YqjD/DUF883 family membrane-anchored ribosome-binding protein